jgi:hypothetical protein
MGRVWRCDQIQANCYHAPDDNRQAISIGAHEPRPEYLQQLAQVLLPYYINAQYTADRGPVSACEGSLASRSM